MNEIQIERIELFKVPPRWFFLKMTTKDGIVGWGEPIVEGRADTVEACVHELSQYLVGHPANSIEDIWQTLYRGGFYRGGPILMSALAGIDQALWDIKGKSLGVPIYELLGGAVRQKMKMYCWIGGDSPDVVIEQAQAKVNEGYKAVKMNATAAFEWIDTIKKIKSVTKNISLLREEFGDDLDIALDFHGRIHKGMVKPLIDELAPYKPMFIEEPVLSENNDALNQIYSHTSIPIAMGERMYSRWDFKDILQRGAVDIIQPDLSHAGGISEVRRIAAMAEAYDIALAPHCPLGPISLASALQIDFACINAFIQESSLGIHYNGGYELLDYMENPEVFSLKDGYISLLEGPGLGIQIDEEKVRVAQEIGHNWNSPIWRNKDGSIAEW
ncbi:MAG: galactonate dehydratase [Bacteroidota bacterium]